MRSGKCFIICIFICSMIFCSCSKEGVNTKDKKNKTVKETYKEVIEEAESIGQGEAVDSGPEKGYDLPVPERDRVEAEQESCRLMTLLTDIYKNADKGDFSNVVLGGNTIKKMRMKIKEQGCPVISSGTYANMGNYKEVERFLINAESGKEGSVVVYVVHSDGGVGREKYIYDGKDMFLLASTTVWDADNKPCMSIISYTRLKEWRYSDKGWFCYELCVPEYPEVTEVMDGSCLIRIKPMSRRKRRFSKQCVQGLGYQGNNLLCSDWDKNHLEKLDYNALYEYLYEMKYKKKFNGEKYPHGIPKDKFESLIMEYLPVTSEMIQKVAAFDKKKGTYLWQRLGCFNYTPAFFETSIPEVTKIKKNPDGTITLTVDAVCEMMLCDEAVITHELTVRFAQDGSFRYLGNKILNGGTKDIPEYQYRLVSE